MLNCEEVRRLLPDLTLGEVAAEARGFLDEHLAGCAACRARRDACAAFLGELGVILQAVPIPEPLPPGAWWQTPVADAKTPLPDRELLPESWRALAVALHTVDTPERLTSDQIATIFERVEGARRVKNRRVLPTWLAQGLWWKAAAAAAVTLTGAVSWQAGADKLLKSGWDRLFSPEGTSVSAAAPVDLQEAAPQLWPAPEETAGLLDAEPAPLQPEAVSQTAAVPGNAAAGQVAEARTDSSAPAPSAGGAVSSGTAVGSAATSPVVAASGTSAPALSDAAVACGPILYWGGGQVDRASHTPFPTAQAGFNGIWNTETRNWAPTNPPGPYGAYADGALVDLGFVSISNAIGSTAVITNTSDVSLSGLMSVTQGDAYNQVISLTAASPRTLTFTGTNFLLNTLAFDGTRGLAFEANVFLAGSAPVSFTASGGKVIVKSDSPNLTGPVSLRNNGYFFLDGALPGVTNWNLRTQLHLHGSGQAHSVPQLTVNRTASSLQDQLNDQAVVTLTRGIFSYSGNDHVTAPSGETLGKLVLEPYGVLQLTSLWNANAGVARPTLTLSDAAKGIDRGANGRGALVVSVPNSSDTGLTTGYPASDLIVPNGVATDELLPWISTSRGEFMRVNSATKILEPVPAAQAPTDLGTWAADADYCIGAHTLWEPAGAITNDLCIHSLGFFATNSVTLTIDSGKTLTLATGGFSFMNTASFSSKTFTVTNGTLTSGSDQLNILCGAGIPYGSLTIASVIAGNGMELIKSGFGGLTLAGPESNTYNGTTYVSGPLTAKKSGSAVAIPGNLVIQNGGQFNPIGTAPISSTTAVTIEEGGVWNGATVTHSAPVTINGGCYFFQNTTPVITYAGAGLVFNGGRISHSSSAYGSLSLQTDVSYTGTSTRQASWDRFGTASPGIELDGAQRTFDISDSATLAAGLPEMVVDIPIVAGYPKGGSLRKTGTGVLQFTEANTYTGGTLIEGGLLRVSSISVPAQSGLTAAFTLYPNLVTFNQPVARSMAVRQAIRSASNTGLTATRYITEVVNDYQVVTTGLGASARPTDVMVDAMSRSGTLGTGPVTVNNTGTLAIDAGIGLTNAVTVSAGGTLVTARAGIGSLTINGGTLAADLSAGTLAVSNSVNLTSATLTLSGTLAREQQSRVILSAGTSLAGTFVTVNNLPCGCTVVYGTNQVIIRKNIGTLISVL